MKRLLDALSAFLLLGSFTACATTPSEPAAEPATEPTNAAEDDGWVDLFNGEDLTGWTNVYEHGEAWVEDEAIHLKANRKFFLTSEQTFSDFEFEAKIMLPAEGKANSGIMFRAHVKPAKVFGYQAECDPTPRAWTGGLYDEGRRKWLAPTSNQRGKVKLVQAPQGEWIQYRIRCVGDHLQIWINGQQTTDFRDDVDASGHFGLQHHGERGQIYRFRDIRIREITTPASDTAE